jgi:hypothetical protein
VIRSAAIVYASYGLRRFEEVRSVAAELESNNLAETVRLIDRIRKYEDVPKYYSSRFTLRFDPIAKRKFVDMRTLVCLRLLRLGASKRVRKWVENRVNAWKKEVSEFDRALLHRTVEGIPITT